jgi:glycosyltransferase involved in cell wall biosynthesis
MKILQFPIYISIIEKKNFSRNITGYGLMALDIATSLAKQGVQVDLLTQGNITNGMYFQKIKILKHTWSNIISNCRLKHLLKAINVIIRSNIPIKLMPHILLYNCSMGYFEKVLSEGNYDLVHIHGIGYSTIPIIDICENNDIKHIVTLHGLFSFSDSIKVTQKEKELEKDFIQSAENEKKPVSVVSTGTRKKILKYLNIRESETFVVILNGTSRGTSNKDFHTNIRLKHNINKQSKILLCVGNLSKRKNQLQIVKAYIALPHSIAKKLVILFLGNYTSDCECRKLINNSGLNSQLILCGNISKKEIFYYYNQSNYNIVASISEGFGLSIIEGFNYGLPCIAFNDIDAIQDLYSDEAMVLVNRRNDSALAEGMEKMLSLKWNKQKIITHGKQYSLDSMANKYINYYNYIINDFEG